MTAIKTPDHAAIVADLVASNTFLFAADVVSAANTALRHEYTPAQVRTGVGRLSTRPTDVRDAAATLIEDYPGTTLWPTPEVPTREPGPVPPYRR